MELESALDKAALEMGYTSLRQKQRDAVVGFLRGRDVFVSLPTGSGKSLCYAILPKVFDILRGKSSKSVAIVVSPLISLMKDQVHSLETKGVSSIYITKTMSDMSRNARTRSQLLSVYYNLTPCHACLLNILSSIGIKIHRSQATKQGQKYKMRRFSHE